MSEGRWAAAVLVALAAMSLVGWGASAAPAGPGHGPRAPGDRAADLAGPAEPTLAELEDLYRDRDYFALRRVLENYTGPGTPRFRFLRAAVLHAFNDPRASNRSLDRMAEEGSVADTLRLRALRLRYHNLLRLHRYEGAVEAAEAILDAGANVPSRMRRDVENELAALRALRGVEPQAVVERGPTRLEARAGRIPVTVEGRGRRYALDTGANFSVLMRSEARALGLRIREAGVELGTATDVRVRADVAVAERVRLGGVELRRVVFLVLPDSALTFDGGYQVRGLLGFPVLEALGRIRFQPDGVVEVEGRAGAGTGTRAGEPGNLALEQLTPLVRAEVDGRGVICRLDTGAGRTVFYEPFLRSHRALVEERGRLRTVPAVGAGGSRRIQAFRLPRLQVRVAGRRITLDEVDVYTEPLVEEEANYLDCNLGRDVLGSGRGYALDFRTMTLALIP